MSAHDQWNAQTGMGMKVTLAAWVIALGLGLVACSRKNDAAGATANNTAAPVAEGSDDGRGATGETLPVAPETKSIETAALSGLQPVELSALVLAAMPPAGTRLLGWDHMLGGPVGWSTDGTDHIQSNATVRVGMARVRVNGRISTRLKRANTELPWTIELYSTNNEKFGPQEIFIHIGGDGDRCFGELDHNCTFSADEAFNISSIHAQFICSGDSVPIPTRYYRLTAVGRAPMIAAYHDTEGSGGATTSLTLALANDQNPPDFDDLPENDGAQWPACARR